MALPPRPTTCLELTATDLEDLETLISSAKVDGKYKSDLKYKWWTRVRELYTELMESPRMQDYFAARNAEYAAKHAKPEGEETGSP